MNNIVVGSSTTIPPLNCSVVYNPNSLTPLVIDHNDIYNSSGGAAYGGACPDQTNTYGNISKDPMFANAATANYQLILGSPAIDTGNNSALSLTTPAITTDMLG